MHLYHKLHCREWEFYKGINIRSIWLPRQQKVGAFQDSNHYILTDDSKTYTAAKPAGQVLPFTESISHFLVFCPFSCHLANCCKPVFSRMEKHIFFYWYREQGASFCNHYTIKIMFQTMQCHLPNFQSFPPAEELAKWRPTNEHLLYLKTNLYDMFKTIQKL